MVEHAKTEAEQGVPGRIRLVGHQGNALMAPGEGPLVSQVGVQRIGPGHARGRSGNTRTYATESLTRASAATPKG
jgi:hypothetical protein